MIPASVDTARALPAPGARSPFRHLPGSGLHSTIFRGQAPRLAEWRSGPAYADWRPGPGSGVEDRAEDAGKADRLRARVGRGAGIGAPVDAVRHQARIVHRRRVVTDDFSRGGDDRQRAAIAERKQAAEIVDDFVGIEPDRFRIVTQERAGVETRRPAREIAGLESLPQLHADVGAADDNVERDAAALALT